MNMWKILSSAIKSTYKNLTKKPNKSKLTNILLKKECQHYDLNIQSLIR